MTKHCVEFYFLQKNVKKIIWVRFFNEILNGNDIEGISNSHRNYFKNNSIVSDGFGKTNFSARM